MDRTAKQIIILIFKILNQISRSIFLIPNGACRFNPTCSQYAIEAIEKYPIHKSIAIILKRILRCNPFFNGGYDPLKINSKKR